MPGRKLKGRTLFITGGGRGIGLAIALCAAREGANIAIVAKPEDRHAKLPSGVHRAAQQIERAGGKVLPLLYDIMRDEDVHDAMRATRDRFGGFDICVNNASAMSLTTALATEPERFDIMNQTNIRGAFMIAQQAVPFLAESDNPHILTISPPVVAEARWLGAHAAYSMSKMAATLAMLGMGGELGRLGIAANMLWPMTTIDTSALRFMFGAERLGPVSRTPAIMAEAARAVFLRDAKACTGHCFIDELVLRAEGVTDFSRYAVDPTMPLSPAMFIPDSIVALSDCVFGPRIFEAETMSSRPTPVVTGNFS